MEGTRFTMEMEKAIVDAQEKAKQEARPVQPDTSKVKPLQMTRRGLPIEGAAWTEDHDLVFFKRYRRMLQAVPPHALRRMGGYLGSIMESAQWPGPPGPPPSPPYPETTPAGVTAWEHNGGRGR